LKISWPYGRAGSSPAVRTIDFNWKSLTFLPIVARLEAGPLTQLVSEFGIDWFFFGAMSAPCSDAGAARKTKGTNNWLKCGPRTPTGIRAGKW
ncbi:MAG: hypothetical protein AB3N24_14715, partial [Leisingera sp.]